MTYFDYLLIPVEISQWVIQNKYFRQFQVFIYLKTHSDGVLTLNNKVIHEITQHLELKSTKTIKAAISDLEAKNWIGINQKNKRCYVRSFDNIKRFYGMNKRIATIFYKSDIGILKAFVIASVISNLIRQGIRSKWRKEVLINGKTYQSKRHTLKYHEVSNMSISKVFNVSLSTASIYKTLACENGFINRKRNYRVAYLNGMNINTYNKYNPKNKVYKVINGKPVFQNPDKLSSNIVLRRRRK